MLLGNHGPARSCGEPSVAARQCRAHQNERPSRYCLRELPQKHTGLQSEYARIKLMSRKGLAIVSVVATMILIGCGTVFAQTTYPSGAPAATSTANCTVNGQPVPCDKIFGTAGTFLGIGFALLVLFAVIGVLAFIFWLIMLIHAISKPIHDKALWIIILLLFNLIGAIVYYFAVKRHFSMAAPANPVPPATP